MAVMKTSRLFPGGHSPLLRFFASSVIKADSWVWVFQTSWIGAYPSRKTEDFVSVASVVLLLRLRDQAPV